jgi:signal transduction histidine kinase
VLGRLDRILRLAGKHYVTSLALWLMTAPPMVVGLLFTEVNGPWSVPGVVGVLVAGVAGHLGIGSILLIAHFVVFPAVENIPRFAWWVGGSLVVAGALRGVIIGLVAEATGVGEPALLLRITTSVALVVFSFSLSAFSLQLWGDYRQKRQELLLSLLATDANYTQPEMVTSGLRAGRMDDVSHGIESARAHTLVSLGALRRAIMSGDLRTSPAQGILASTDSAWRDTSHDVWEKGLPDIPRITPRELLRTWSASKPFSVIVLAMGPLYGFARALETTPAAERWMVFGLWLVGAIVMGVVANSSAARMRAFGPAVLVGALLVIQALPVLLGNLIAGDSTLLLQLWFVGFVSSTISLVFGFPPALERQGQRVIDQLEKRVDQATLETLRAQGEHFIASQRLAHYLHSELRGHFLRLSMSLREAVDKEDRHEAVRILDDLQALVTKLSPHASSAPPQENLVEFLDNWARMIKLTHNLDTVTLPPLVAMAAEAIVMEAVNDVVRHAQGTTVDVSISKAAHQYRVVVTSDGQAPPSVFSPGLGTRLLNTYAPGRWGRETLSDGGNRLWVELSAVTHHSPS